MNDLQVFNYEGASVRVIDRDGEPWFVGKDVAEVLGYSNPSKALIDHVDEEDKLNNDSLSSLGQRGGWLINDSGLYSLILSSRLPGARQFKRWVTSEVLPSIRKHGIYATPITIDRILNDPDLGIRLFTQLKEEREKRAALETTVAVQTQQIAEMNPKATYYDTVLQCKDLVTITRIAKDFRLSAQALNRILAEKKVQFKQGDMWVLYQKYAEKGYTQSKTYTYGTENEHAKMHTLWTQAGRLFIYDLLKADGILPTVEME
jgi:prophage antirepressor-like protein